MFKDRQLLESYLSKQFDFIVTNKEKCKQICNYAYKKYEIPKALVLDLISNRTDLSEVSIFILYIILDSITNNIENRKMSINEFYTQQEIDVFEKSKYIVDKVEFPLIFKVVQIREDQWIGKITIKELMRLRKAQIVNYNIDTQRTMQRIVKGDKEVFKISVKKKSVEQIKNSMENDEFISNTFTLNIPLDSEYDFHYDEKNCQLVINSLERFDITDGYHRYLGACKASDNNPNFDYLMEVRIVNWSDDKAKQFTFQEDQKTKMKKVESDSLNTNNPANITVTRLNESIRCNYKGLINRNEGIISYAELSSLIHYFYFKDINKSQEKTVMLNTIKELTENFNILSEYNNLYLEKRINYRTLLAIMFCFDYYRNKDKTEMCKTIDKLSVALNNSKNNKFLNKKPRKNLMKEVEKIMKEVV